MIISMTGFARNEAPVPGGTLACELRSVNHRYLEPSLRLPDELRPLEPELRGKMQKELRRGKVDCTFNYRTGNQAGRELEVDVQLIGRLAPALDQIAAATRSIDAPKQINLVELLRFPGVVREAAGEPEVLLAAGRELFAKTLEGLKAMRASEGARLRDLVLQRCTQLESLLAQVRQRLPEVQAAIRTRFDERLAELKVALDSERMEQEVALLVQRMDVAEELDRLDGHIAETRKTIASPEAAGRRLDFLMQEYNREANTLSSKSQDLMTTRLAVDMKVLIEQMREQVQNIE
ncbi:MAG: YicC/YloC family endoribonuclease [Pseudomonadota bacterium]